MHCILYISLYAAKQVNTNQKWLDFISLDRAVLSEKCLAVTWNSVYAAWLSLIWFPSQNQEVALTHLVLEFFSLPVILACFCPWIANVNILQKFTWSQIWERKIITAKKTLTLKHILQSAFCGHWLWNQVLPLNNQTTAWDGHKFFLSESIDCLTELTWGKLKVWKHKNLGQLGPISHHVQITFLLGSTVVRCVLAFTGVSAAICKEMVLITETDFSTFEFYTMLSSCWK